MPYSLSSQSYSRYLTLKQLPTLERVILTLVIKRLLFGCSRVSQSKTNPYNNPMHNGVINKGLISKPNNRSEDYDYERAGNLQCHQGIPRI
jgi:hypothetical protein